MKCFIVVALQYSIGNLRHVCVDLNVGIDGLDGIVSDEKENNNIIMIRILDPRGERRELIFELKIISGVNLINR